MREIVDGILHWTTFHDGIGAPVSSYAVPAAGVVIDPRIPDEGLESLAPPQQVVLTTGLHRRHTKDLVEAFGCVVRAPREAGQRLADTLDFEPYSDGDELAPGVTAIEIGALAPDEYALHLDADGGAIVLADALVHYGETLAYVPDGLMGDDAEAVKAGLTEALRGVLGREFDHLLPAHGEPIVGGGKAALRDFLETLER